MLPISLTSESELYDYKKVDETIALIEHRVAELRAEQVQDGVKPESKREYVLRYKIDFQGNSETFESLDDSVDNFAECYAKLKITDHMGVDMAVIASERDDNGAERNLLEEYILLGSPNGLLHYTPEILSNSPVNDVALLSGVTATLGDYVNSPDYSITVRQLNEYGYNSDGGMLPLNVAMAEKYYDIGAFEIFTLYDDGASGIVESREQIEQDGKRGVIFGVQDTDWEKYCAKPKLEERDYIKIDNGIWYVIDEKAHFNKNSTDYEMLYLLEHSYYGDKTGGLIITANKDVILDDVWNGWLDLDEYEAEKMTANREEHDTEADDTDIDHRNAEFNGEKGNKYDASHVISSLHINGVDDELSEDRENLLPFYVESNRGNENLFGMRTDKYPEAVKAYTTQILNRVTEIALDREDKAVMRGVKYIKLTGENCLPDGKNADFTGKLIIVDANSLLLEYRSSTSQLMECTHGNGARPNAIGTSVFGKELYSGASVVYGRHQILGVADEAKLPKWAKTKLEIRRDPSIFEYGGFHFKPERKFEKRDGNYFQQDRNSEYDHSIGISSDGYAATNSCDYSREQFYTASGSSDVDIFRCLEDNKLYIPRDKVLLRYYDPPEKELRIAENRALKEYGNLIDTAISEGVERKSVPYTLEVLDAQFGKEKTNELLATVALTSLEKDGRISGNRREWAKSVIGDTHGLKSIHIKSHPAHFDNLMMYAMQRDAPQQYNPAPEAEKPSMLAELNETKAELAAEKAARPDKPKGKKRGDMEVD
jgi:hypothetical protein